MSGPFDGRLVDEGVGNGFGGSAGKSGTDAAGGGRWVVDGHAASEVTDRSIPLATNSAS